MKSALKVFFILVPFFSFAQIKVFNNHYLFINQLDTLSSPLTGGINSPQFSSIHLNADTLKDLIVFDKMSGKILPFIAKNKKWEFAPMYASYFPNDIQNWLIFRDYDADGRADLFTHTGLGVKVYKNITGIDGIPKFQLQKPYLESIGYSGKVNIQIKPSDIPAIQDADNDGDMDILCFEYFSGSEVEYHQNLSMELFGKADSLVFKRKDDCWGGFEEISCKNYKFGQECKTNLRNSRIQHVGGASLYLFDYDKDNKIDALIGKENCTNINFLKNTTQNGELSKFTSLDTSNEFYKYSSERNTFGAVYEADINFDGKKELLICPNISTNIDNIALDKNVIKYFENTSQTYKYQNINFLQNEMLDFGENASVAFCDFNFDNQPDLTVAAINHGKKAKLYLYKNVGGAFKLDTTQLIELSGTEIYQVSHSYSDYNNDNVKDLFLLTFTAKGQHLMVNYGKNTNPITFSATFDTLFTFRDINTFTLFDYNQDGKEELFVCNYNGKIDVYQIVNQKYQIWKSNIAPTNLASLKSSIAFVNLNQNPQPDLITTDVYQKLKYFPDFNIDTSKVFQNIAINPDANFSNYGSKMPFNSQLAVSDLNNDKLSEIWVGTASGGIEMFTTVQNEIIVPVVKEPEINIYPNPGNEYFNFYAEENGTINMYDLIGKILISNQLIPAFKTQKVNTSHFQQGLYLVEFVNQSGKKNLFKWVKK